MITSQYIMILALGCIALTWAIVWATGRRSPAVQKIFAALTVQSLAAILLTFSSSLILSFALAVVILGAITWMIHSASSLITSSPAT